MIVVAVIIAAAAAAAVVIAVVIVVVAVVVVIVIVIIVVVVVLNWFMWENSRKKLGELNQVKRKEIGFFSLKLQTDNFGRLCRQSEAFRPNIFHNMLTGLLKFYFDA